MTFITDDVVNYLDALLPPRDEVLVELERLARQRRIPIVGPAVGRLLYQLARLIHAERVFEMGSAIGYSTIWLARAVPAHGVVYYTDGDPKNAREAEQYLFRAGVADRVKILVGDALDLIDQVDGEFDLVFTDVDKHQYPMAFTRTRSRIRRGGLLVADNVLWSGRVARGETDPATEGIREFNRLIYSAPDFFTTIIPLRDGVSVSLKL